MSSINWRFVKEREDAGGLRVRLFAADFNAEGKARLYRRVSQRSRAGCKRGAWSVEEFCERQADGTVSPWRGSWSWRDSDRVPPRDRINPDRDPTADSEFLY